MPNFYPSSSTHTCTHLFSSLLTFLCILSIIAPLLFSNTSYSFSCLLFFCPPSIYPSIHPTFFSPSCLSSSGSVYERPAGVGMAAWHRHTRLPVSPPGCPTGGLGNIYLLYIAPFFTPLARLHSGVFDAPFQPVLRERCSCSLNESGIGPVCETSENYTSQSFKEKKWTGKFSAVC